MPTEADTPKATNECPVCFAEFDASKAPIPDSALACPPSLSCEAPHFVCIQCINKIVVDHSETSVTRLRWRCPICRVSVPVRAFEKLVLHSGSWCAAKKVADIGILEEGISYMRNFEGTAHELVATSNELAQEIEAASSDVPSSRRRPSPFRTMQRPLRIPSSVQPSYTQAERWRWEEVLYLSEGEQRLLASTRGDEQQMFERLEMFAVRRRARHTRLNLGL